MTTPSRGKWVCAFRLVAAVVLPLCGCTVFEPATELEALNQTGSALEVLTAPCGSPVELLFVVPDGERRSRPVRPGCHVIEGWTEDWRAAQAEVDVAEGSRHVVRFEDTEPVE